MFVILSCNQESFNDQVHVKFERLAVNFASHDLNHFFSEFEICSFESEISGWRDVEDKSKVDMNYVSFFFVDENVSIVSVFYLQNVRNNRVCRLGFYEIFSCLLEHTVVFWPEVTNEKLVKRLFVCFSN